MKGDIEIDSEIGYGTTFNISIPLSVQKRTKQDIIYPTLKIKVLLIKANQQLKTFNKLLKNLGCEVIEQEYQAESLLNFSLFENQDIDLILIYDQMIQFELIHCMNFITNFQTINEQKKIPFYLVTQNKQVADRNLQLTQHFNGNISKHIPKEELYDFLKQINGLKNQQRPNATKVVLIDDDNSNLMTLQLYAEEINLENLSAQDGIEAYNLITSNYDKIALIFIDNEMPETSGIECVKMFRSWEKRNKTTRIQIVMLSGQEGQQFRNEALSAGADQCITKPIRFNVFKEICLSYAQL